MPRKIQIAVIGDSQPSAEVEGWAEEVGRLIARHEAVVVCGGLGGVMAAAARGAAQNNGTSVGILPTYEAATAAPGISIAIPSGLGHARNMLVVASGDAVIALPWRDWNAVRGRTGTDSEKKSDRYTGVVPHSRSFGSADASRGGSTGATRCPRINC